MQFPARLRVVAPSGTELYSTPVETWAWLESRLTSEPNANPQHRVKRRRPRPTRHQPTYRRDPLTMDEALNERRQAMEAAARIGGATRRSAITPPRSPQKEDEHSDSDSETAMSTHASILLPMITPGTADEII
ncbi:hypothetical protein NDU88_003163 [Pleurodeles waltl]|uniref:Uncharacterized protein n=1 Tax=Pleurodeles waltl TaxID=8319 RepID=A0AAV7KW61_PLEWA|nr:hypothetical protein NDU88_003163 [Pleurodeles waltl]